MTKISKNIKKIRTAKNLTQDALSEKLFVTRQTVSGWENGRTQPDIEMLCKLSEVFEVPVEDLIYGEKRFATDEEKDRNTKRSLVIIFSVLASLLTAVGLILIFVTYWENFPLPLKTVCGFVPMLAGQAAAIFTFIKHRESIAWRECAAVLWCAGMVATVALIDSIYMMPTDFSDCLLIDTLLVLPVIYILDSVTPLLIYYALSLSFTITITDNGASGLLVAASSLLYFAGLAYVILNRKKKDDTRHNMTQWISVLIAFGHIFMLLYAFDCEEVVYYTVLTTFFLAIYIGDKSNLWSLPYSPLGIIGTTGMSIVSVFLLNPDAMYASYYGPTLSEKITAISAAVICPAIIIIIGIIRRNTLLKNPTKAVYSLCAFVLIISQAICCGFFTEKNNGIVYLLTLIASFILSFALIAEGITTQKFAILNIGLIATLVLIGYIIFMLVEVNMLGAGILLVFFGILLFTVNLLLSRKTKQKKEENKNA